MKKTDIAMIVLVAALSMGGALLLVSAIPGLSLSSDTSEKVKTIDRYSSEIDKPDPNIFNSSAINPTVDITIGGTDAPESGE